MTAADDVANRRHLAALIGGPGTRWREHIERGPQVLGVQWDKLPLSFRQKWWKATSHGKHFRHLPHECRLLADEFAKLEADKREAVAATARQRELLRQAEAQRPCEQCLRPEAPCHVRCLRSLGVAVRPEPETIRRKPYVDLAKAPPWLQKILHEHFPDPSKVLIEDLEEKITALRRAARPS